MRLPLKFMANIENLKDRDMNLKLNADRFTGDKYVKLYNQFSPTPPIEIINQSLNYLNRFKANNIVDIGSGTGLSTKVWSKYAEKVIGIEPSKEMLNIAKEQTKYTNIEYKEGYGNDTGIESDSIDIIACSQSFHWMEPHSTLKEIDKILKKNGVLVIYDVIWPPTVNYEYEKAYNELFEKVNLKTSELEEIVAHKWKKTDHLKNIIKSGYFKFSKETYYHKNVKFDKDKFKGIALSQGGLEALIKKGYTTQEIGIDKFIEKVDSIKESIASEMTYNYRVIFGLK